jgi:D-alanyl-lipoteichoic acid acyltransferase DltB (MBOAT superfamily)
MYWFAAKGSLKYQNIVLIISSYFFYACWDWRFLLLLFFSTALDYYAGLNISNAKSSDVKKLWLRISIVMNLGILGVFKYYNFFAESFAHVFAHIGLPINPWTLKVMLPVGISFYTFHGLSYIIDVYKGRIKPTQHLIDYAVFVGFFPLLVAGPIERATHLLPQIQHKRTFDYTKAVDGLLQILWGLFKKVVIADQCAVYANQVFNHSIDYSGSTLVLGAVFFAFQIYGDFSGYSDIALGTARLFGIELLRNFAFPYFSRDISEFWRRWHISLSSWFRDYLYIPLGGSKGGTWMKVRNTFILFLVSGFWHGANWTFIVWGLLNALYIMPSIVFNTNRKNLEIVAKGKRLPTVRELFSMLITFGLTVFAWIFFRSENLSQAIMYVSGLFSSSLFSLPTILPTGLLVLLLLFITVEWVGREGQYAISNLLTIKKSAVRWSCYLLIAILIFLLQGKQQKFIYFQF